MSLKKTHSWAKGKKYYKQVERFLLLQVCQGKLAITDALTAPSLVTGREEENLQARVGGHMWKDLGIFRRFSQALPAAHHVKAVGVS